MVLINYNVAKWDVSISNEMYLIFIFLQIDEEFERLHKGASDNFLARFASFYVPRILMYCNTARPDLFKRSSFIEDGKFILL